MHKIIVFLLVTILVVLTLNISETAYATYGYNDYENNDYRNYWIDNKNEIKEKFNDYINKFNESCIDHTGLRNLLKNSKKIENLSLVLINSEDELEILSVLHSYVHDKIEYEEIDRDIDSEQVLELRKGDCSEKSILLYSLLESHGIKTFISNGNSHMFVWAKIDNTWLPIETTSKDLFYIYKNWDDERYRSEQSFLLNRTDTLLNNVWCI